MQATQAICINYSKAALYASLIANFILLFGLARFSVGVKMGRYTPKQESRVEM